MDLLVGPLTSIVYAFLNTYVTYTTLCDFSDSETFKVFLNLNEKIQFNYFFSPLLIKLFQVYTNTINI